MSSGNFNLKGWKSNLHILEPIQHTSTNKNVAVLGLVLHTDSDMLSCKVEITNISEKPITKRFHNIIVLETETEQYWGTFVQNRVQKIRSLTSPAMWHHIPGTLNASHLVSRGCSGEDSLQGKWWEEPTWLLENQENWPKSEDEPDEGLVNSEKRKTIVTTLTKTDENVNWYCILPKDRVRDAATFKIVDVDLAGPLYLKHILKTYIVLYTCAVYRAIHLELITPLTTEAFFQSLRRFISRRGRPLPPYILTTARILREQREFCMLWIGIASLLELQNKTFSGSLILHLHPGGADGRSA
ncbi:integrase catalytic domain-containing protein [Trichonephila clavipes]|nr:integrase catalytic domain-containing protein [Trichonephila clavipes]